jgi:hypothetical protein
LVLRRPRLSIWSRYCNLKSDKSVNQDISSVSGSIQDCILAMRNPHFHWIVDVTAISLQSETMAIIQHSTMKSKSREILNVRCKPKDIGHLKLGLFWG